MKIYLIALFCCFTSYGSGFAALSPSQIEKSMQLIDQDKDLRGRIEQPQKSFVKEVIVTAPFELDKKAVEQAALPYKGSWITKDDIKQLIEALKQICLKSGNVLKSFIISSDIKNSVLKINCIKRK